jgi:phosphatidylserine/phosphatidylglycerophosphate/cardiolipin synthase-like enzyme
VGEVAARTTGMPSTTGNQCELLAGLDELPAAGAKVEEFLPLNPLRRRWAVHLRNHRKLIVIDGRVAFTGGMDIGDEYAGRVAVARASLPRHASARPRPCRHAACRGLHRGLGARDR